MQRMRPDVEREQTMREVHLSGVHCAKEETTMTREDMLARLEKRFPQQQPATIKRKPEHKPYRAFAMPAGFYGTQYYANNCKKARERIQRRQHG